MSAYDSLRDVPRFIKAKTPEQLQDTMYAHNSTRGAKFTYFDIQKSGDFWYAWFYDRVELTTPKVTKRVTSGKLK